MRRTARALRCAWLALPIIALLLTQAGCASLRSVLQPEDTPPAAETDADAAGGIARYTLEVQAPGPLRTLLATHLDLARFQNARDSGGITTSELARLVASAPAQARALLETEGYFEAQVRATREDGTPPRIRVSVEPGPRTRVERVRVVTQGDLLLAAEAGDREAQATEAAVRGAWPLKPGQPFTQAAWTDAKNRTLARLWAEGYPLGTWSGTAAQIDPAAQSASIYVLADSGPLFRFGDLRIRGLDKHDPQVVRNLSPITPGQPYKEKLLNDFQERLQKAGLFESAAVQLNTDVATAAAAPVRVRVRELPLQQATVGVGISANTGPRVTLEHLHRKAFGWNATARNEFELGRDRRAWEGDLTSHPLKGLYRNLAAVAVERLQVTDEVRTSWRLRGGRTQDTERIERLYFAELQSATTRSAAGRTSANAASLNYHWTRRDVDSVLLPTRGLAVKTELAAGYAFGASGDIDASGPFGRGLVRVTAYKPFGGWYGQGRVEAGHVYANAAVGIPDPLLFRAGGDDSVRGYGYRTLGPERNGVVTSGRTLFTSSAEIARPVSARLPAIWWAAFVDAGNAADDWGDMKPAVGYGLGLRWRSPVGPLRADLAYGQDVGRVRLHISVGIAL